MYLFPSRCFISEPLCQQDRQRSSRNQISMERVEDLDSVKNKSLIQYPDPYRLPQYADPKQLLQEVHEMVHKEACKPVYPTLHTNPNINALAKSVEHQQQVPFLKLLSECGEKLGIRDPSGEWTQGTSPQQDLQPERTLVFRE